MRRAIAGGVMLMRWLVVLTVLFGCVEDQRLSGPVFDVRVTRKEFTLEVRRWIDLVIVVDSHHDTLRTNMRWLASSMHTLQRRPDLHIGFINACGGELQAASSNGRFLVDEKLLDGSRAHNFEGELGDAMIASFDAIAPCSEHRPLESIRDTLAASSDFLREDAELAIVILTTNDDDSVDPVEELARRIKSVKRDDSMVIVGAALGGCRSESPQIAARPAPRLRSFLDLFPNRSTTTSICQEDLTGVLGWGELIGTGSVANPCFDVEIPDPSECSGSIVDGSEQLVPACELDASGVCWRIARDPSQCPGGVHQQAVFANYAPTPKRVTAILQCALPSML